MNVCPGCGGRFADVPDGATHRYMESSSGCWATYGEVLAREYEQPEFFRMHKFTVDAYAVRRQEGAGGQRATAVMQKAAASKTAFRWLDPPSLQGEITVADIHRAASAEEHAALVRAWAELAWNAWSTHHETVRGWLSAVSPAPGSFPSGARS